jgi:hypothetical protein
MTKRGVHVVKLTNDFHNTEVVLHVYDFLLSYGQVQKARRALCGVKGCRCGGFLGERGGQEVAILPMPGDNGKDECKVFPRH